MTQMTTRERFSRIFEHRAADRIPIFDSPWNATLERWQSEGMPSGINWIDYFELDNISSISVDISPRYEERVLEETEEHRIFTTPWGVTLKDFKHTASVPEFMDFNITSPDRWQDAKARMTPSKDRVNWDFLKTNYPKWQERGDWIVAEFWFGFDVTHSWMVGTETFLMAMVMEPEWCRDIFNHYLDMCIAHFDLIWEQGYTFDSIRWPDDMGYKQNQFFSLAMYRDLLKPVHQRAIDWAHNKGIKAHLHSCGDINPLVPELIEMGLDALNPLEVKAGMNPVALKEKYGDKLVLHGGINAVLWDRPDEILEEITTAIPVLKENGGYIFASDHSIPSSVSLEDFRRIIDTIKTIGRYD